MRHALRLAAAATATVALAAVAVAYAAWRAAERIDEGWAFG